jgi:hypothetical protein
MTCSSHRFWVCVLTSRLWSRSMSSLRSCWVRDAIWRGAFYLACLRGFRAVLVDDISISDGDS